MQETGGAMTLTLRGISWRRTRASVALLAMAAAMLAPSAARASGDLVSVIVRAVNGHENSVAQDVERAGGRVGRALPIVNGFSADVPSSWLSTDRPAGVLSVTPNSSLHLLSMQPSLGYDPETEFGSLQRVARIVGAPSAWSSQYTGRGVDVALIDSGVVPAEGLTAPGKIVNGPDLSFDSQDPASHYLDTYGHGTHMASIIAGKDSDATPSTYGSQSTFVGIAPDARIVSVKVAAADGATDVSQVIAALDWIVQHRNDNGLNIRVINLSFGTRSAQPYTLDPLAYAAEVAWRKGIVVVVAVGNDGQAETRVSDPAIDPFLIAVSSDEPNGTQTTTDDSVSSFATGGSSSRHADVIAPGRSVLGLRVPGSYLDQNYPTARVGERFFRGSGTSQATAVVSGVVALMLQQRPSLTPDQVKFILKATAKPVLASPIAQGSGVVSAAGAKSFPIVPPAYLTRQPYTASTGTGSLEQARGGSHVADNGVELVGEQDIFGAAWDGATWAPAALAGTTWSGGDWNGNSWSGNSWSGNSWSGNSWSGNSWSANSWSGNSWSAHSWSGNSWSGNSWSGNSWSANSWSANSWSGNSWSGNSWSANSWSTAAWGA